MRKHYLKKATAIVAAAMLITSVLPASISAFAENAAAEEAYFTATAAMTGSQVSVSFSEKPIGADFNSVKVINTENKTELSKGNYTFNDRQLIIPVSGVESAVEYAIVFPEKIVSDKGSVLSATCIYATSPAMGENTQEVELINDTFDTYSSGGNINVPENWLNRQLNNSNYIQYYSDAEHDKAVKVSRPGGHWSETCVTRNFGKAFNGKFTIEFDFNPLEFNNYMDDENDPALLAAVTQSVKDARGWDASNPFSYKRLNRNMSLMLAPVAENGSRLDSNGNELSMPWEDKFKPQTDSTYITNNAIRRADSFFHLYGDRLGFGEPEKILENGWYVKVEEGKWYHVKLDFDMEKLTVAGDINGTSIGTYNLPASYNDGQFGSVAERAMFYVHPNNNLPLNDNKATYVDSTTGETKTITATTTSAFAFDNFNVTYTAPEFKICSLKLSGAEGIFGPLQSIDGDVTDAKISFTIDADTDTLTKDTFKVADADGKIYDFDVTGYDEKNYIAEIRFKELLKKGTKYTVTASGIESKIGTEIPVYKTEFETAGKKALVISNVYASDADGAEVTKTDAAQEVYANVSILNSTDADADISVLLAGYENTDDGEKLVGIYYDDITVASGAYKNIAKGENEIKLGLTGACDRVVCYADNGNGFLKASSKISVSAKENYIEVSGTAQTGENVKAVINKSDNSFVFADVVAAKDGKFDIKIAEKLTVGEYKAYAYFESTGTYAEYEFSKGDAGKIPGLTGQINAASDKAALIDANKTDLGIDPEIYKLTSKETVAEMLSGVTLPTDAAEATEELRRVCTIAAIKDGNIENLFEYEKELNLGESKLKNWYNKEYVTEAMEEAVTDDLGGDAISDAKRFEDALLESFVLNTVAIKDGYGNAEDIICEFYSEIGLLSAPTEGACRSVAGTRYEDFTKLKAAIEGYKAPVIGDNGHNSGNKGNSGGGGGGSYIPQSEIAPEYKQEEAAPMNKNIFEDIDGVDWARPAIVYLTEKGIVNGKTQTSFEPNAYISREEIVKMLIIAFGLEGTEEAELSFIDADKDEWYYSYIAKAYAAGVVSGYSENEFGIGDPITRQDMSVMLYNAAVKSGKTYSDDASVLFEDDELIADYAKTAVYSLRNAKIINGVDNMNFAPVSYATRAEAAKIIYGMLIY